MTDETLEDQLDGYFASENYPSAFHAKFSPAWIDAVLHQAQLAAPRDGRARFGLADLGCGDGTGLLLVAAAYPDSRFIGIDAMPDHIAAARALQERLGLTNIRFVCATFGAGVVEIDERFDYITCQGVIAWVSARVRAEVFAFAGERLAPGGVAVFGYSTLPGWLTTMPLQRLLRAFGEALPGTPVERFRDALAQVAALAGPDTHAIDGNRVVALGTAFDRCPTTYYPHEYFNRCWSPFWSGDIHAELAMLGLRHAGEAGFLLNREDFFLKKAQRSALAAITDPFARATAGDILAYSSFRVDCFTRDAAALADPVAARLRQWVELVRPVAEIDYTLTVTAGALRFDNPAARAVVATLAEGPAPLAAALPRADAATSADLVNTADILLAAQLVRPVDPPEERPAAAALNALLAERAAAGHPFDGILGRHGPVTA